MRLALALMAVLLVTWLVAAVVSLPAPHEPGLPLIQRTCQTFDRSTQSLVTSTCWTTHP